MGRLSPTERQTAAFSLAGFKRRLWFYVLLILLPLFLLSALSIYGQYRLAANEVTSAGLSLAHAAATQQQTAVAATEPFLSVLAKLPEVRTKDGAACSALFAQLLTDNPLYVNLGAVDAGGTIFCSGVPVTDIINVADRSWFKRAMETRAFAAGEFAVGAVSKKRTINFGYPFEDEAGKAAGVVYAALDVERFSAFAADIKLPPDSTLTIIDREGNVLARYPEQEKWVGRNVKNEPVFQPLFGGPQVEGVYQARGLDNIDRLYAFTPLDPRAVSSPTVTVGFSKKILYAEVSQTAALNLAGLILVSLMVALLAYFGGRELVVRRVAALQEVDRLKDEFVSLASHQLRTPLTAARWLTELLASGSVGPLNETQKRLAEEADRSLGHLLGLVDDLLDLGRLDAGKLKVTLGPVDVPALVGEVIRQTAALAAARSISVESAVEGAPARAHADQQLVRQVVMNLLSNAIKYSPDKGTVSIRTGQSAGLIRVSVEDRGIGIPEAEKPRIFERFFRASNVRATQSEGTGLGLPVARAFVEAMGGRIGFTSKDRVGSTFWFELPVEKK